MKKKAALFLAFATLMASLSGCAGTPEATTEAPVGTSTGTGETTSGETDSGKKADGPGGKITVWLWSDNSFVIEPYMAQNPNAEIEMTVISSGDYLTKIQTTVASGGKLPDIVWGEISNRGQLFAMDVLKDLSQEPFNINLDDYDPSVINTTKNEDGVIVGVESSLTPAGLAYQKSVAKQYLGTDDIEEIKAMIPDWDSFIELGRKVKAESNIPMFTSLGDVYYVVNGQMKDSRITDGVIHKAVVEDLFGQICKFRDAGIVGKLEQWTPAWYASFGTGSSVFAPMPSFGMSNWIAPNLEGETSDWQLITPPGGGFSWGGTCWGITKDCQNDELAWDFIEYATKGEGMKLRAERGETPSAVGAMDEDRLNEPQPIFDNQPINKVYMEEIVPTITTRVPTQYDFLDICTIELVLTSMNTDYNFTAQDATNLYIQEMTNQAPELVVE